MRRMKNCGLPRCAAFSDLSPEFTAGSPHPKRAGERGGIQNRIAGAHRNRRPVFERTVIDYRGVNFAFRCRDTVKTAFPRMIVN